MTTEHDRLRALAPISDEEVAALALDGERELAAAIVRRPRRRGLALLRGGDGHRDRPPPAALAASVALIALAGAGLAIGISGSGGSAPSGGPAGAGGPAATGVDGAPDRLPQGQTSTTPSAPLPAATVPEEAGEPAGSGPGAQPPRYLLPDGWRVTRADEYDRDGEMTFVRGDEALELNWRTGSFEEWLNDRAHDADRLADVEVDGGQRAAVFVDRAGRGFFTALWQVGDFTLEFRVTVVPGRSEPHLDPSVRFTADEFSDALRSLRLATLRAWLAAVPEETVVLDERPQTVEQMLADVPLPPGFDAAPLMEGELVKDRYQLGATVISAVSCGWIDVWASARRARDRAGVARAAEAMARVTDAAVVREMEKDGAYSQVLRDFAAAMRRPDGRTVAGKGAVADEAAEEGLGCSSR